MYYDLLTQWGYATEARTAKVQPFKRLLFWGIHTDFSSVAWLRTPLLTIGIYRKTKLQQRHRLFSGLVIAYPQFNSGDLEVSLTVGKEYEPFHL